MIHRARCGSLFDDALLDELLGGARADALYSDPPWGPALLTQFGQQAGHDQRGQWPAFVARLAALTRDRVAPDGPIVIEMGDAWASEVAAAIEAALDLGPSRTLRFTGYYGSASALRPMTVMIWRASSAAGERLAQLPWGELRGVQMPRAILAALALPAGATVLDPCCGKGYTARACAARGLSFRGVELVPGRWAETDRWLAKLR